MDDLFSYGPKNIKEFFIKNKIALLCTVIFHLLLAIILIQVKVDKIRDEIEMGVQIDFEEEVDMEDRLEEEVEVPTEWIERVYELRQQSSNRAVNVNDEVNKEISTEDYVNQLLEELESEKDEEYLKNREKYREILSEKVSEQEQIDNSEEEKDEQFTGPTTISYEFLGAPLDRNKRSLYVPVYRCEGSALVIVESVVRKDGSVHDVKVISAESANEPSCFIQAAQSAAEKSLFRSSANAPEKHRVRITYQFVAQ